GRAGAAGRKGRGQGQVVGGRHRVFDVVYREEDGIRGGVASRGLGDVYRSQYIRFIKKLWKIFMILKVNGYILLNMHYTQ
ncbi:hypothetical protein BUY75_09455, partial [Staphylococcus epidermidis]